MFIGKGGAEGMGVTGVGRDMLTDSFPRYPHYH